MKKSIFASFAAELRPDAILATNTSSISITKIAAAAVPAGVSPASEEGKNSAGRVVGAFPPPILNAICAEVVLQGCIFSTQYPSWYICPPIKFIPIILHWQKLVELISALQTAPETLDRARSFAIACGKGALKDVEEILV